MVPPPQEETTSNKLPDRVGSPFRSVCSQVCGIYPRFCFAHYVYFDLLVENTADL